MILIVDDQDENIFSLQKLLESYDFKVDTALSGPEALKKVLKRDYALIILDVQMPIMDGFEVAQALAGYSRTRYIPIIFLSAVNTDKKFITQGYASGGMDYVAKPVDPEILMLKVKTFYTLFQQRLALDNMQQELRMEIEQRKKAQQELNEKMKHLYAILEALPQLAFTADSSGNIEFVNNKWRQYADRNTFPNLHPDDPDIQQQLRNAAEHPQQIEIELRLLCNECEEYKYHLFRVIPFMDGGQYKWIGTFTDIDAQKQVEKRKDEFLSIASHELKTPLTSIKAYAQLLQRTVDKNENSVAGQYIDKMQRQVSLLGDLVVDLLDTSRIENGKLKIDPHYFDLEELLDQAMDTIRHTNEHRSLKIHRKGHIVGKVLGDRMRIEQVLINYLSNAVKYAPEADEIFIKIKKDENKVQIEVVDQGIGIPEYKLPELFTKFYRVEESSIRFQGLGIGLYICAEIIKLHGGSVGAHSVVGKGSTFYFTLPIEQKTEINR
ncbi:ATP-binding response regulator [Sphingobacterium paucimobilis]|uniref:histidine kinase n=1 Tax=Sphingobacterium paucimobilis HER1398 TaxID=1346330 RepID=U2J2R8_9SPHI|nr:hybrid sensor histidine kinase/response regulator [Sphingobacterium paucimobilis]ERJ59264.1 hypothetical protein M472_10810 [Sphingobacterium paucimobilis HER1398]